MKKCKIRKHVSFLLVFAALFLMTLSLHAEEKVTLKQQVDKAVGKLKSSNMKEKITGIEELQKLVYKDKEGKEVKKSIPYLKKFIKDEVQKGGSYWGQETMYLLTLVGDDEVVHFFTEISKSGPPVIGQGHLLEPTDAGLAKAMLELLQAKKKFQEDTKVMSQEGKIKLLLNELKPTYNEGADKYVKYQLRSKMTRVFLARIGKSSVPYLLDAFEEAMEWQQKDISGITPPYDITPIKYSIPEILSEICAKEAIPVIKKWLPGHKALQKLDECTE